MPKGLNPLLYRPDCSKIEDGYYVFSFPGSMSVNGDTSPHPAPIHKPRTGPAIAWKYAFSFHWPSFLAASSNRNYTLYSFSLSSRSGTHLPRLACTLFQLSDEIGYEIPIPLQQNWQKPRTGQKALPTAPTETTSPPAKDLVAQVLLKRPLEK